MTKTTWNIDPAHSEIEFKVKHLMITNVTGRFSSYESEIETDGNDFTTARINVKIDSTSVSTANDQRDTHLKSADFFDPEKFPDINFKSTAVKQVDDEGSYELSGDLTIRGISKPVQLAVEFSGIEKDPWGNTKAGFSVNGKINRKDWGLNWNSALESGGLLVGEDVKINCEIQLLQQK